MFGPCLPANGRQPAVYSCPAWTARVTYSVTEPPQVPTCRTDANAPLQLTNTGHARPWAPGSRLTFNAEVTRDARHVTRDQRSEVHPRARTAPQVPPPTGERDGWTAQLHPRKSAVPVSV